MQDQLDIKLHGREYRVACPPDEREALLESVAFLDQRLSELASKTHAAGEKLAMMTALNIAHEFLEYQRSGGFDLPSLRRRIEIMNSRLERVVTPQD